MVILLSEALLRENKKSSNKMLPQGPQPLRTSQGTHASVAQRADHQI